MIGKRCIVRTHSAGVFAGILLRTTMYSANTANYMHGQVTSEVNEVLLTEVIEIIPTTDIAESSIKKVPVWPE